MAVVRRRGYQRHLAASLFVLGVVTAAAALLRDEHPEETESPYSVARVTKADLIRTVSAVGQLSPLVSVEVSSQISGLVTSVEVDFNMPVKKGQTLAKIDPSSYEQQLRQRQADLEAARANYALFKLNAGRLGDLYKQGIASLQEYDQVRAQLQQSSSTMLAIEAAISSIRVDLERCVITSPIDGVVIFKQIEVGKTVVSSLNAPTLFTIAPSLSRMKIVARISEVDIGEVRVGQEVTFTVDAIPEREFGGRLTQIRDPYVPSDRQPTQVSPSSGTTFEAAIGLENSEFLLRPGLTAHISIVVERRVQVLQIPNSALRVRLHNDTTPNSRAIDSLRSGVVTVYRLPGGDRTARPEPVPVHLGVTDSFSTEVLAGLQGNDLIVTGVLADPVRITRRGLFDW
jgi:HlyD family secretion protein